MKNYKDTIKEMIEEETSQEKLGEWISYERLHALEKCLSRIKELEDMLQKQILEDVEAREVYREQGYRKAQNQINNFVEQYRLDTWLSMPQGSDKNWHARSEVDFKLSELRDKIRNSEFKK